MISTHERSQDYFSAHCLVFVMAFVRNPLQDWSHAPNYLPRDLWDKELSPEVQQRQKLDMLLAHFIA
jgi:hypothetical protein